MRRWNEEKEKEGVVEEDEAMRLRGRERSEREVAFRRGRCWIRLLRPAY